MIPAQLYQAWPWFFLLFAILMAACDGGNTALGGLLRNRSSD